MSLAVYLRPADIDADLMIWTNEFTNMARVTAEFSTVIGVLSYILVQLGGEVVNIGLLSFLKQLVNKVYIFNKIPKQSFVLLEYFVTDIVSSH